MKLNIHVNLMAIQDMYSWLKVGDYHRLPLEVHADFIKSDTQNTYIRHIDGYKYNVNAKLLKVVKKSFDTNEEYTDDYGLAYFEVQIREFKSLYFFMQFYNNNEALDISMAHLQEGEYYTADIKFFLECGAISSIVYGLWDDIDTGEYIGVCRRQPYTFVKIEEIYTVHGDELESLYYDVDYKNAGRFVLSCLWIGADEFGGKVLDYYAFRDSGRLEFKNIGSFRFTLIDLYVEEYPVYLVVADNLPMRLHTGMIGDTINEAIAKIEQGTFIEVEYGCQVSADFEDINIKFYDGNLIHLKDWEEEDVCEANILVQLSSPEEANVLTKTSLNELQAFALWNKENIENHIKLLAHARENSYRYVYKYGNALAEIKI